MRLIEKDSFCPLCGRTETSKRLAYTSVSQVAGNYNDQEGVQATKRTRYYAAVCLKCGGMLLYSSEVKNSAKLSSQEDEIIYKGENDRNYNDFKEAELFYPIPNWKRMKNKLPEEISKSYEVAIKIKTVHSGSFAVLMRVTLEKVCDYFNVPKNNSKGKKINLHIRLRELFKKEEIPQGLSRIITLMKDFGNKGAHEGNVDPEQVPKMEEYLDFLLQYLFETRPYLKELEKSI